MWQLVGAVRLLLALPVLVFGILVTPFIRFMDRPLFEAIARPWYRCLSATLGIRCHYLGERIEGVSLLVSNHISWADILVIGGRYPFDFLAMQEVANWPLVGWLARHAGTLFIRRGKGAENATSLIAQRLRAGRSVILFPEGRTGNGVNVKRFHSKIFDAAINEQVPVSPVALFYADRGADPAAGSRITFADGSSFVAGLWRAVCGRPINATMRVFPALAPTTERHQLAMAARSEIEKFVEFTVDSSNRA